MTSEIDFFAKAQNASDLYREAAKHGRKLGTLASRGIFLKPDAPAHFKNALHPMATSVEWESRVESQLHDSLIQKLGPGATVSAIYRNPELRKVLTPDEIERLWADYFRAHPHEDRTPWAYPDMIAEANARRTNRKLANGGGLLK